MKKILLLSVMFIGATLFFTACSPYYHQPNYYSYRRAYPPPLPARVYVTRCAALLFNPAAI